MEPTISFFYRLYPFTMIDFFQMLLKPTQEHDKHLCEIWCVNGLNTIQTNFSNYIKYHGYLLNNRDMYI